jgi:hypothetical protein
VPPRFLGGPIRHAPIALQRFGRHNRRALPGSGGGYAFIPFDRASVASRRVVIWADLLWRCISGSFPPAETGPREVATAVAAGREYRAERSWGPFGFHFPVSLTPSRALARSLDIPVSCGACPQARSPAIPETRHLGLARTGRPADTTILLLPTTRALGWRRGSGDHRGAACTL